MTKIKKLVARLRYYIENRRKPFVDSKGKVTNINERKVRINPAMLIFIFLFLYLVIYIIFYMSKSQLTLYKVTKYNISQDNSFTGLIIRDEQVYSTSQAGYIAYYVSNDSRVKVGQTIYSIDENGNTLNDISSDNMELKKNDYTKLSSTINDFSKNYEPQNFSDVYSFKEKMTSKVFELTSDARYSALLSQVKDDATSLDVIKSTESGSISYYIDGLENLSTEDDLSKYFDDYDYSYTKLSTGSLLKSGAPAYKMLGSNTWNIILKLSKEQYDNYCDMDTVSCYLNNMPKKIKANIECSKNSNEYYAKLTLYKYAINFLDQRFVNVDLLLDNSSGLKIPNSAITEKEFYTIPKEWFSQGAASDKLGVSAFTTTSTGETGYTFIETTIYDEQDDNYYVSTDIFEKGTVLCSPIPNNDETYIISDTATLSGVYNANNGYCVFTKVEVYYSNDDYSIVNNSTKYGLSAYDNIVLDASKTSENVIIY